MTDSQQYLEDLAHQFDDEPGVAVHPDGMYVRGRLFAFVIDDDLVLELPLGRLADLEFREIAAPFVSERHPTRDWVRVSDRSLWPELLREAHEYVGEPPVGGDS
jgi:hypothetical protein